MSNHSVDINKTTLRDHIQKKRMLRVGVSLSTTKPTLIIQKVAQTIAITLLSYGCPAF